jgi:hypothetical protein
VISHPAEAEAELAKVINALEEALDGYKDDLREEARATADFKLAYFRRFAELKQGKASDKTCEAEAHVAAADQFSVMKAAEAKVEATKALLRSLMSRSDSLRTLIASNRAAAG